MKDYGFISYVHEELDIELSELEMAYEAFESDFNMEDK